MKVRTQQGLSEASQLLCLSAGSACFLDSLGERDIRIINALRGTRVIMLWGASGLFLAWLASKMGVGFVHTGFWRGSIFHSQSLILVVKKEQHTRWINMLLGLGWECSLPKMSVSVLVKEDEIPLPNLLPICLPLPPCYSHIHIHHAF